MNFATRIMPFGGWCCCYLAPSIFYCVFFILFYKFFSFLFRVDFACEFSLIYSKDSFYRCAFVFINQPLTSNGCDDDDDKRTWWCKITAKMDDRMRVCVCICMLFKCVVFSSYTFCLVATTMVCTKIRICWYISAQRVRERQRKKNKYKR